LAPIESTLFDACVLRHASTTTVLSRESAGIDHDQEWLVQHGTCCVQIAAGAIDEEGSIYPDAVGLGQRVCW
jgi:hypothetical protein